MIARGTWRDHNGNNQPLLTEEDVHNPMVERGTLTDEERQIINNHISVTIDMLESLPFPKKLQRVPEYAGGHHEKMDGSGFPKGLTREQMSIPARIMAIADIFEALTSQDRPYKDPMPISVALGILKNMRDSNHIDADLYHVFVQDRVWQRYGKAALAPAQIDVEDPGPYM
jgi:HD-GYP domain-containing protein (c-di-GMP phosphodiesterase class II)